MKASRVTLMRAVAAVFLLLLLGPVSTRVRAQAHRDPLNDNEADQIRNAADDPEKRVGLLLTFARARLNAFEESRRGNAPDRSQTMYQQLQEYADIVQEIEDNLDSVMSGHVTGEMASKPKARKPVEAAINGYTGMLATLNHIKSTSAPNDLASYHFQLDDSIDATQDGLKNAKSDLVEAAKQEQTEKQAKQLEKERLKQEKKEKKLAKKREKQQPS